mgnify:CR=1 FL=1
MKKVLKLTLAVALTMGATSLFAQKFGRINTQEIIALMPETKAMQENLDTFGKELQDNIETMNVEFNNKLQEFQKNSSTYNDAVREMKAKELQDLQNRSREFQEMSQQQYQQKYNELLTPIIEKAKNAIDKVSAAGGYTAKIFLYKSLEKRRKNNYNKKEVKNGIRYQRTCSNERRNE